jgi:hypothetical protein
VTPKDISLRLRHWLIKKLGGFTEQYTQISRFIVPPTQIKPEVLRFETRMSRYHLHDDDAASEQEMFEYAQSKICFEIADELLKNHLVVLECEDDKQRYERIYRGTVAVFKAEDTALFLPEVNI